MAYSDYAFGNQDLWNVRAGDSTTPTGLKLDPSTSTNQIVISDLDGSKLIATGQFLFTSLKATLGDVLAGKVDSVTEYLNSAVVHRQIYSPAADFLTLVFGTYQQNLQIYSGNDVFVGSPDKALDDFIRGAAGNDKFTGNGSGQYGDYFDGESGFDVAYLRGKYSDYKITAQSFYDQIKNDGSNIAGFKVTDNVANRDGVDYYANVERLYFSDKVVALDIDGNAGQAYRLYKAALNRTPDSNGLAGWIKFMDDGGALTTMSQQFIDSSEFRTKYGALDNTGFINQLYQNVLNRNGEPTGVAGWVGGLNNGLSRADVLKGFSESSENQANVIGQIKNGIAYTEWWLT